MQQKRWLPFILTVFGSAPLAAQTNTTALPLVTRAEQRPSPSPFVTLGSDAEDRLRIGQLLDGPSSPGFLIRSPSQLSPSLGAGEGGLRWRLIEPELRTIWNSDLPFSLNDGALWAGRGTNLRLMAGVRGLSGRFSFVLAPEFLLQRNLAFQTIPSQRGDRSPFASPWHEGASGSLDLPLRFGGESFSFVHPGQSSVSAALGRFAVGAATENLWWGPGIRNAIVMSNNAAGIPHLFLRTAAPLRTQLGEFEGRWIAGMLRESAHFDFDPGNDARSISALAIVLQPAVEPNLTVGVARAVYGTVSGSLFPVRWAPDVFRSVGRPNAAPASDSSEAAGRDQIFSLFGRWAFPESGFEAYAEWARFEEPTSLHDFLAEPGHSQGYTLGLQFARPTSSTSLLRLQSEVTYLEPSPRQQVPGGVSSYASRIVPQGYTHHGQIIGASIGPGASSQWIAGDYLSESWKVGLFGGRIRWETAAFYNIPTIPSLIKHDVSVFVGARGGYRVMGLDASAALTIGQRFNYLFQNVSTDFGAASAVDIRNYTLDLTIRGLPGRQ